MISAAQDYALKTSRTQNNKSYNIRMEKAALNTELLKKLGNIDQIAGIRETICSSGNAKGLGMLEVYNAAGLRFTVVPDRCLDIYDFSFKGLNLSFHSKNGLMNGRNPAEDEFFHQWPGGMLTTCGLANVGDACFDGGVHPVHGRIGSAPAKHVSVCERWQGSDYILSLSGEIWETRLYGRQLSLTRTISTGLYDKTITITDTITNHGKEDEEFMLLYHINFGYPLLNDLSTFICSDASTQPRNSHSHDWIHMCAPDAEPHHQLYLHTMQNKRARAAIVNPEIKLAGFLEFDTEHLPYLCEWKHMAAHDYVVALEPCNCIGLGRTEERANGTLKVLPAYGSFTHSLSFGVLEGDSEIREFSRDNKGSEQS